METSRNTRWHHVFRLAAVLMACAMLAGITGGPASARAAAPPLDLAAMTLRPTDLETAGLTGYGMSWSILGPSSRAIAEFVEGWGWDARVDDGQAFRDAAADRGYLLHLAQEREADGWITSDALVASFVLEYDDAAAAEEGFAAAAAVWGATLDESKPDLDAGDEQLLFAGMGANTNNGAEYGRMLALVRIDNLISGVSVHAYAGSDAPGQEMVEDLAERQADLVVDVRDDGGPGLSGQLVRLRVDDGMLFNWDYYVAESGAANRFAVTTETDGEFAERQASYDDMRLVERYHLEQIVADESPTGDVYAWFNASIDRYANEDAAEASMDETRDGIDEDETATLQDAPALGDEAIAFTSTTDAGNVRYRIVVRAGDIVFRLSHVVNSNVTRQGGVTFEPQPAAINDLAERQLACLEGEHSCERPVRIPDEMRGEPGQE